MSILCLVCDLSSFSYHLKMPVLYYCNTPCPVETDLNLADRIVSNLQKVI